MTANEFRRMALDIPQAVESAHMSHPDFRIAGKIFASLGAPDANWGMVKLTPDEQHSFITNAPIVFKPCSGAWGKRGCTNVYLTKAEKNLVHAALAAAAKNVALQAKKKNT